MFPPGLRGGGMPYSVMWRGYQTALQHISQVKLSVGRPPDPTWKRQPSRQRANWTDQLHRDNNSVPTATLQTSCWSRSLITDDMLQVKPTSKRSPSSLSRK